MNYKHNACNFRSFEKQDVQDAGGKLSNSSPRNKITDRIEI